MIGACAAPGPHPHHLLRRGHADHGAPDDGGRLRRAPRRQRDDEERHAGRQGAGQRPPQRQAGAGGHEERRRRDAMAVTTPKIVGRRCVLTRINVRPDPCSSASARMSSQAQRPTRTLTSRSSDQPSSISMERTARDRRSQSVSCDNRRSADVQVSLQNKSSVTVPDRSRSAPTASRNEGLGPRLVCGLAVGSATAGGARMPRIRPRTRASGWMKCR